MNFKRKSATHNKGEITGIYADDTLESQTKIKVLANLATNLTLQQLEEVEQYVKERTDVKNYKEAV